LRLNILVTWARTGHYTDWKTVDFYVTKGRKNLFVILMFE
jgi:hypothetical protein